jgi:hypothetical protein
LSSYVGIGASSAFYHTDSDHEMLESTNSGATAISDDDLDPVSSVSSGVPKFNLFGADSGFDDYTSKRLQAFIATTLHFEHVYLAKLQRLLGFKQYLDENYSGSQADVSVIFSGIGQIRTTHEIVAEKLQDYLDSLSDLLSGKSSSDNANTSR